MFNIYENTTNKVPKRKKKQSNLSLKSKKTITIVALISVVLLLLLFFQNKKNNENYNNLKLNKNEYLVYTKYSDTSGTYKKEIPYVNMKADVIKLVNKDIKLFCNDFINLKRSVISYEYDINGIILSVVVKVVDNEKEYAPEAYFRTYNINLETEQVIADTALLEFFNVTPTTVEERIKNNFEKFYEEVVEKEYFKKEECNYNCFLKWRGVTDYLDNIHYYVKDGKLIAYKPFVFYSLFGEETYFKDKDFEFVIASAPATN